MTRAFKIEWRKIALAGPMILAFAMGAATLTYAAFELRLLAFDGGDFSYRLLTTGELITHLGHYRYSTLLPQMPAWLSVTVFGFEQMPLSRMIMALTYSWEHVIGTVIAISLCYRLKKPEIALGPLATFGFVSLPLAGHAFSSVAESVSLFWAVYIIQVYGQRTWREKIILSFLCLPLAFGHETTALLAAFLLLIGVLQRYWFAAGIQLLAVAWYIFRIWWLPTEKVEGVMSQSWATFDAYAFATLVFWATLLTGIVAARFYSRPKEKRIFRAAFLAGSASLFSFAAYACAVDPSTFYNTYRWRMYATPLLMLIAATLWALDPHGSRVGKIFDTRPSFIWWRYLYGATLAGVFMGAGIDYAGTKIWSEEVGSLRRYMASKSGSCVEIPFRAYRKELKFDYIQSYDISQVWALLQRDGVISQFVFVGSPAFVYGPQRPVCQYLAADESEIYPDISNSMAPSFLINRKAFTYSFLPKR